MFRLLLAILLLSTQLSFGATSNLRGAAGGNPVGPRVVYGGITYSGGTPSLAFEAGDEDGEDVFGSLTDNGLGDVTIVVNAGVFSSNNIYCGCTAISTDAKPCQLDVTPSATSIRFQVFEDVSTTGTDTNFRFQCTGPR